MNPQQLLHELADLPVAARMKRLTELGRDTAATSCLQKWERGDGFERRLSLQSCYGSRDGARVARMASDKSRLTRNLALKISSEVCDLAQLEQIFAPLGDKSQRHLLITLIRKNRRAEIDALIEGARERGENWQLLLSLGSLSLIERHFAQAFAAANANDWARLARAHPRWALEKLIQRARQLSAPDDVLRAYANAALDVAAHRAPDSALQLIQTLTAHEPLARIEIAPLLDYRPLQVAQLLLQNDETPESRAPIPSPYGYLQTPARGLNFARLTPRLPLETLLELARRRPETLGGLDQRLKPLAPTVRGQLFEQIGRSWRDEDGQIAAEIVALLPPPLRESEARRHLKLPSLGAAPAAWLPYSAFLPFDEMRALLDPIIGDPDPLNREAALSVLVRSLRFYFGHADEVIQMLEARRNEQDPIRAAIFRELSQLPPSRWNAPQLQTVARLIRYGLDARDLSAATASWMQQFIVAVLPFAPAWAAEQLAITVKERGQLSVANLENRLSDAQMQTVGAALLPALRGWLDRERNPFISAFTAFGRRLRKWDEGAVLLIQAAKNGPTGIASSAASLLAKQRRDDFAALVPQLLKLDKSWGAQAPVYHYVCRKAPNLLTLPMLGRAPIKGKFWTGRTRFVLPFYDGFAHWAPAQQQDFALTLYEVIRDAGRDLPAAIRAIGALANLPDIAPNALTQLASLQNERPALREAALRSLSHLDAGGGVATLIEALDDERARIAIYGLRKALTEMPARRALQILRAVPLGKVTVAKEVVRLLGDLGSADAFDLLLELAQTQTHRDVRVAIGRALWEHLDDERSWPILTDAANSDDAALAQMAARTTAPRLSQSAKAKLAALLARLLRHLEARVRMEAIANPSLALLETRGDLRAGLFSALSSELPAEYRAAAIAICASAAARDADLAARAIAQLQPRRRALSEVLATLSYQVTSRRHFGDVTHAILAQLARDPLTTRAAIAFAYAGLSQSEWANWIERALESGALHADALGAAVSVLSDEYNPARANLTVSGDETLLARWQGAPAPELRRLALADLAGAAQSGEGWTDARFAQLEAFRADSSLLVAAAAQWTFPGDESEEIMGSDDDLGLF